VSVAGALVHFCGGERTNSISPKKAETGQASCGFSDSPSFAFGRGTFNWPLWMCEVLMQIQIAMSLFKGASRSLVRAAACRAAPVCGSRRASSMTAESQQKVCPRTYYTYSKLIEMSSVAVISRP